MVELPGDVDRPLWMVGLCDHANRGLVDFEAATDAEYGGLLTVTKIISSDFRIR